MLEVRALDPPRGLNFSHAFRTAVAGIRLGLKTSTRGVWRTGLKELEAPAASAGRAEAISSTAPMARIATGTESRTQLTAPPRRLVVRAARPILMATHEIGAAALRL